MSSHRMAPAGVVALVVTLVAVGARAAEPNACLSTDPSDWPAPAKPYFMFVVDTSGSMTACTNPATLYPRKCPSGATKNSCNMDPTRMNDAKCALRNTVLAFSGEVNFGLATYGTTISNCSPGACVNTCEVDATYCFNAGVPLSQCCPADFYGCNFNVFPPPYGNGQSCGNYPGCSSGPGYPSPSYPENTWLNGGNVVVPMQQDPWWLASPPPPSNVPELLKWFDGSCDESKELYAAGWTPIAGSLRAVTQYLRAGWSLWSGTDYCPANPFAFDTPMDSADRTCRSVNVILVTDGNPSNCEPGNDQTNAENAASDLYNNGVTIGGKTWPVRVHVINFAGGTQSVTDAIAAAGGTNVSLFADDERSLSVALSNIVSSAIRPEACNNSDDNCNGCSDEGYRKYCNRGKTPRANPTQPGECCQWANQTQRDQCLTNHAATVSGANPLGDQWLLPCWDPGSSPTNPETKWLCTDPGEVCDDADNNCDGDCTGSPPSVQCGFQNLSSPPNTDDEGFNKCPLCPVAETCDGVDQDCDNIIDNAPGSSIPFSLPGCTNCVPSAEICDGCDNDCNGVVDDAVPDVACGFVQSSCSDNSICLGTRSCPSLGNVSPKGGCLGGNSYGACTGQNPSSEACNGCDDDCNGVVDDGLPPQPCNAPGDPGTWVYDDTFSPSQCHRGQQPCNGACQGAVGASTEICDGVDNDCNGVVDDGVPGVGNPCGTDTGACSKGATACVGGVIVCQGGTQPGPEVCNGIDDDCDGSTDEPILTDAPATPGCWTTSGSSCSYLNAQWDPPPGATCDGVGSLTSPCQAGTLTCQGASRWVCVGDVPPSPEVCDGVDNDCDGTPDDGVPPPGTTCGTDVGACDFGTLVCAGGAETCQGGVGPTAEVCDGDDDDCDGVVDGTIPPGGPTSCTSSANCAAGEQCLIRSGPGDKVCAVPPPGTGVTCGTDLGECSTGTTSCIGGAIVCQGNTGSQPEICDGLDNDCDGAIDDGPLTDAPASPGCWQLPGSCCSGAGVQWCPPPGGSCTDAGSLTSPCAVGTLVCTGGGWQCQGGVTPATEVCDGVDNDCDGVPDDGNPGGGGQCGTTDVGACELGTLTCTGGSVVCVGEVGPTPELCNGVDDDCNGTTDDGVPGVDNDCGLSQGECQKGKTACVGGVLVCQGGVSPVPESCNGLDDDCNGFTDDGPLTDDPPDPNCWTTPGTTCGYGGTTWDPPPGGTCTGLGSLTSPCATGSLACDGANGWICQGGQEPGPEVCDGVDNDCNGTADDGNPGGGDVCGSDVGECVPGTTVCVGGVIDCQGETGPVPEICDGLDNDCDTQIDNGIPIGGSCQPTYDTAAYPGDRTQGECRPGQNECDGAGGLNCVGGVGPVPEVCDGLDNDCDGQIDEPGPAPDGVDGTADPLDSSRTIGDPCGVDEGECRQGQLACQNGAVVCLGAVGPQPEQCDCADNDCDGKVDEDADAGDPPVCSPGKTCIDTGESCQCASPCKPGEFPCPTGTECLVGVKQSGTDTVAGDFCVDKDPCGDCSTQTELDGQGTVVCAPAGTVIDGKELPVCVCQGRFGCQSPCFGIDCPSGQDCVATGAAAGTCQPRNNCNFFGCGSGKVCHNGACVDDPCAAAPCASDEVCKPNVTFDDHECVGSCATVSCGQGQRCESGECVDTGCGVDCASGEVCRPSGDGGFACGPSRCTAADGGLPCSNGAYCDPTTGSCGDEPCTGVHCPDAQICVDGECRWAPEAGADGGTAGAAGAGTGGSGGAATKDAAVDTSVGGGPGAGTPPRQDRRVFGLATGGGGCSCRTAAGARGPAGALALLALLAVRLTRRRRPRRRAGRRDEVAR